MMKIEFGKAMKDVVSKAAFGKMKMAEAEKKIEAIDRAIDGLQTSRDQLESQARGYFSNLANKPSEIAAAKKELNEAIKQKFGVKPNDYVKITKSNSTTVYYGWLWGINVQFNEYSDSGWTASLNLWHGESRPRRQSSGKVNEVCDLDEIASIEADPPAVRDSYSKQESEDWLDMARARYKQFTYEKCAAFTEAFNEIYHYRDLTSVSLYAGVVKKLDDEGYGVAFPHEASGFFLPMKRLMTAYLNGPQINILKRNEPSFYNTACPCDSIEAAFLDFPFSNEDVKMIQRLGLFRDLTLSKSTAFLYGHEIKRKKQKQWKGLSSGSNG